MLYTTVQNGLSSFFWGHQFLLNPFPLFLNVPPNIKGPGSISNFGILLVVANLMFNFPLENNLNIKVQFEGYPRGFFLLKNIC